MENMTMECIAAHDIKRGLRVMHGPLAEGEQIIKWDGLRDDTWIGVAMADCKKNEAVNVLICGVIDKIIR